MTYFFDKFKKDKFIEDDLLKNYKAYLSLSSNTILQKNRLLKKAVTFDDMIQSYAPFYQLCFSNCAPILKLDNNELLEMMNDTEMPTIPFRGITLPFDDFLLCFSYEGFNIELCINAVEQNSTILKNRFELKEGEKFYMAHGFVYKMGGKKVSQIGELNFSTITVNMDFEEENLELFQTIYKIARNLLIYISTEKAKEHIKTKRSAISKVKNKNFRKNPPKKSIVTNLFTDVKYTYIEQKNAVAGAKKRPHRRRGHFRMQPYGKKGEEKTYISKLIEPTFINMDSSEEIPQKTIVINKK